MRCGKFQDFGRNNISFKNDEAPKDPIPKRNIRRPGKDASSQLHFDQFLPKRTRTMMDGEGAHNNNDQHEYIQPTQNLGESVGNENAQKKGRMWLMKLIKMKGRMWVMKLLKRKGRMWLLNLIKMKMKMLNLLKGS